MTQKQITAEERLIILEEAIKKAKRFVEGYPETTFSAEECMRIYDRVYFLCIDYGSEELYKKFVNSFEESIHSTVLPSLVNKEGAALLVELVVMWSNYRKMAKWLCRFFVYLDRYFVDREGLISLDHVVVNLFHDLVFKQLHYRFQDAALTLVEHERQGVDIDLALVKLFIDILSEIRNYGLVNYYQGFESAMLTQASVYCSRLASEWLLQDSSENYVQKAFWCLSQEKRRASQYNCPDLEAKLLQAVKYLLLEQNAMNLMKKKEAEDRGHSTDYQEMLSKCAGLTLQENRPPSSEEWLRKVMEASARLC